MAWPTDRTNQDNVNDPLDLPAFAREDIREHMDLTDSILDARGVANGVCDLDQNILIPLSRVPVVDISRGGTGATNESAARNALGLGSAATKDVNVASGVANLNVDKEVRQMYKGAAAANPGHVLYANGSWAAPYPTSAGWITQAMLKTASGTVTGGSVGFPSTLTLPGGKYGFYPQVREDGDVIMTVISGGLNDSWTTRIGFEVSAGGEGRARQEYVQSSPPYDLGDGQVPLFIFVGFRDGEIVGTYEAPEPPWALNGPTDIHSGLRMLSAAELADPYIREPYLDKLMSGEWEPVAEGMELKNFDMPAVPHPFDADVDAVLIDPVGDECLRLFELQRHGYAIADFIYSGALQISNTPLNRCAPPGVTVVQAKWA